MGPRSVLQDLEVSTHGEGPPDRPFEDSQVTEGCPEVLPDEGQGSPHLLPQGEGSGGGGVAGGGAGDGLQLWLWGPGQGSISSCLPVLLSSCLPVLLSSCLPVFL